MNNLEALTKFHETLQLKRSKQTADQYKKTIQQFLEDYLKKPYQQITLQDIDNYFIWLQNKAKKRTDNQKTGQGIARLTTHPGKLESTTINKYLSTIKRFLKFVGKHSLADEIEFAKTQKWKPQIIDLTSLKKLLLDEKYLYQTVQSAWENKRVSNKNQVKQFIIDRNVLLFQTLFTLGIRIGEAHNLKRESFNFELKQPIVRVTGKTGERTIPLDEKTVNKIKNYLKQYPIEDYLFCTTSGGALGVNTLKNYVKTIFEEVGLPLHSHSLRHGFATALIDSGVSIEIVSELLGHSSLDMTKRYVDVIKGRVMKPYNPMNELM